MATAWRILLLAISATGCQQLLGLDMPVLRADAADIDADPNAPTCTIVVPNQNTRIAYDEQVRLEATASDPQDGTISPAEIAWYSSLQIAPLGTGTPLVTPLRVGINVVSCVVTDSTNRIGTATVTVECQSPYPVITHPGDGETRPKNQPIPFNGNARDLEDGAVPGTALVWSSSKDGPLGSGASVTATLSDGAHIVTLAATDSDGNTYTTSIGLTIQ